MKTIKDILLGLSAFFVAIARAGGLHTNLFKDGAHLLVGVLIGGAIFDKGNRAFHCTWLVLIIIVEVISSKLSGRPLVLGNP